METDQETLIANKSRQFRFKQARLQFWEHGEGDQIILAFHGFGQTKDHYLPISKVINKDFKLFSFDLPFHGNSEWMDSDQPMTKEFFRDAMAQFLKENQITRFSIMGFSMGGKFALSLANDFPKMIDNLILIAPDGIKTSLWYTMATYSSWARGQFRRSIMRPGLFHKIVSLLKVFGLLDKGVLKFTEQQMNTRAKRRQVYYSWIVFRKFHFSKLKLLNILNTFNIPVTVFLGKYDKMIDKRFIHRFMNDVNNSTIIELESGHSHMLTAVAEYLKTKHITNLQFS